MMQGLDVSGNYETTEISLLISLSWFICQFLCRFDLSVHLSVSVDLSISRSISLLISFDLVLVVSQRHLQSTCTWYQQRGEELSNVTT